MSANPLQNAGRKLHGWVMESLRYHRGSVLANQMGFQVLRAASKTAGWHLRSRPISDELRTHADALDRDGVAMIHDFLPAETFRRVRDEFERSRRELRYQRQVVQDNSVVEECLDTSPQPDFFPVTRAELQHSERVFELASAAIRRRIEHRPQALMCAWHKSDAPSPPDRLIGANYIHCDVHYPTIKMWLYLSDVDERNGAFMYAKGSHKTTLARLAYEYDASVRVARAKRDGELYTKSPYGLARAPTPAQLESMGIREESMCGKANTLLVANTQGFHRQGEFDADRTREKVLLDFRAAEASWYFRLRRKLGVPLK